MSNLKQAILQAIENGWDGYTPHASPSLWEVQDWVSGVQDDEAGTHLYFVIGRRWFEKVNGNTYHSVRVYKDGEYIGGVDFAYGYGSQYEQTALEIIRQDDPTIPEDVQVLWQLRNHGHKVVSEVADVGRKKDL